MSPTTETPIYMDSAAATATIADRIRNPLTSMRIHMECLRAQIDDLDPRRAPLDRSLEEIDRIASAIEAVLDHAMPSVPDLRHTDLARAIGEATSVCLPKAERLGVRVSREGLDRPLLTLTDAASFAKSVRRLLENAIEASPAGEEAQLFLDRTQDAATVTIVDRGHGMSRDEIDRFGSAFSTNKARGLGLGAHLALRDLKRLGAKVEIRSKEGEGTTIRVHAPLGKTGETK